MLKLPQSLGLHFSRVYCLYWPMNLDASVVLTIGLLYIIAALMSTTPTVQYRGNKGGSTRLGCVQQQQQQQQQLQKV